MAQVVNSSVVSCPSCAIQAVVRIWSCGCAGATYPNHPYECKQPRPYFDSYNRTCQKLETHGANPQTH